MADHPRHPLSDAVAADVPLRRSAIAIGAVFFVNGATYASWTPRLPELQRELGISDGALGLTLVGMGLGGLAATSFSGWLVDRRGSRTTTLATSAAMSLWLPVLGLAPTARPGVLRLARPRRPRRADRCRHELPGRRVATAQPPLDHHPVPCRLVGRCGRRRARRQPCRGSGYLVARATPGDRRAAGRRSPSSLSRSLLPDRRIADRPIHGGSPIRSRHDGCSSCSSSSAWRSPSPSCHPTSGRRCCSATASTSRRGAAGLGFVAVASGMFVGRVLGDRVTDAWGLERTRRTRRRARRHRRGRGDHVAPPARRRDRLVRHRARVVVAVPTRSSRRPATSPTARTAAWRRSRPGPGSGSWPHRR